MLESIVAIGILGAMFGSKSSVDKKKKRLFKQVGKSENGFFLYCWETAVDDWDRAHLMNTFHKNMRGEPLPPWYVRFCLTEEMFEKEKKRYNETKWTKGFEESKAIYNEAIEWIESRGLTIAI